MFNYCAGRTCLCSLVMLVLADNVKYFALLFFYDLFRAFNPHVLFRLVMCLAAR